MRSVGQYWSLHESGVPCHWVSGQRPGTQKESTPMNIKNVAVALVTLIASSAAQAQEPMQWRVEDGGNGHWYGTTPVSMTWPALRDWCTAHGGHLATLTSAQEWMWVKQSVPAIGKFVGGYQDHSDAGYIEPTGGWKWVSGEPFVMSSFMAMDDCPGGSEGSCGCVGDGNQDVLHYTGCCSNQLDDVGDGIVGGCDSVARQGVIEFDADCNNDGIVDYGQCRDGSLPDYNGNNIPDCCEDGTACTTSLIVNGSFELGVVQPCGWICIGVGDNRLEGWEVTLNSVDRERTEPGGCNENWFASHGNYSVDMNGCSVGGIIRQQVATEVGRSYMLSFDMSLNPTNVSVGLLQVKAGPVSQVFQYVRRPTNPQPNERRELEFVASSTLTTVEFESLNREYPAQWNGPVIDSVRLIPIGPSLPACAAADLFRDFNVNGADLGILLSQWGPNTPLTESDLNNDGVVNGADLGILLGFWGPCPN